MRILVGFVLLLLFAGIAHAKSATGYSKTEACNAAMDATKKAKEPSGQCSCYEFGEKIACNIVPFEWVLDKEQEAPEVSEQLVSRPPVKKEPLAIRPLSCIELNEKRDGELAERLKRNFIHLEKNKQVLSLLNALDEEMRADKPMIMVEGIALRFLLRMKTIGKLSQDFLGYVNTNASDSVNSFEALVINDEDPAHFAMSFIMGKAEDIAFPELAAIKGIDNFGSNRLDEKKADEDRRATWASVENTSQYLRKQIDNLNQKMASGEVDRFLINEAKNEIDAYCNQRDSTAGITKASAPPTAVATPMAAPVAVPIIDPDASEMDKLIDWFKSLYRKETACDPAASECEQKQGTSQGTRG